MRFARFGVTLERLEPRHIQTVRRWRNSAWVRPYMRCQTLVHPDDQVRWFATLEPTRDWYFSAHVGNAPFAVFHVKAVDWTRKCGESGGFVGNPAFIGRPEPAQATLAFMDFAFLLLDLESLEAQYSAALPRVVRFNDQLGYQIFREEGDGFVRARVTAQRYFACASAFRQAAATLHGVEASLCAPDPWLLRHIDHCRATRLPDFQLQLR
jgi:hypothetical protein